MVDVFEEVEEQLRSARYQTIVKKGWPYVVGALVIGVLATLAVWGVREQQRSSQAKASESYQQGLDALAKGDKGTAEAMFAGIAKNGPPAYKAMALMQQAGLRSADRRIDDAVALLDQAAGVAKNPTVEDAAKLKAAYLLLDTASLADMEKRLDPLAKPGRPYAVLAREALAMKRMASGQTAAARQTFSTLAISPEANEGLQTRANIAMGVIDAGQAANLTAAAKAAAALPPGSVPPPQPIQPAPPVGAGPPPSGAAQ